jgi:Spy/CpxP family protein refolding chaperone
MKKIFAIICATLAVNMASAQPPMGGHPGMGGGREQGPRKTPVERIAGLVEELKLTPEQAEKFAPVYLAYQGEVRKIRKDLKTLMDSYNGKEIDEKLAFRMVMDQLNADADIIACKKEYMRVFKNYLTPEQLSKIFLVEKRAMRPQRPEGGRGPGHGRPQGQQPAM